MSNGQKIKAPKPLIKRMRKLKKSSKNLSRKTKGSKRYESQRKQLAKFHAKVADTRTHFLHKLLSKTDITRYKPY
ncbi:transposase [Limnoraphis robusta]|uniref:transposase n=1 Tax=Limnoraphis robusta TaxID=1118279 RepID=UPI003899298E